MYGSREERYNVHVACLFRISLVLSIFIVTEFLSVLTVFLISFNNLISKQFIPSSVFAELAWFLNIVNLVLDLVLI